MRYNIHTAHTGKKAQITIFIILGVLILAGAITIFLLREQTIPADTEITSEQVPENMKPLQLFVESCLYSKAREAFVLIGQHGGYIDMRDPEISEKTFALDPSDPTQSDAAFMSFLDTSHVAYWWYMKTPNDCINCLMTADTRPTLKHIEMQADKYIEKNLKSCINGFGDFKKQGWDILEDDPVADVIIGENDVTLQLYYPLNVTIGDSQTSLKRFYKKLNLNYKGIYDFATDITNLQVNSSFLDNILLHLISINSGADLDKLPPFFEEQESFVPLMWSESMTKMKVESLMTSYTPLIQINGTKGAIMPIFSENKLAQQAYKPFFVGGLAKDYPKYSIRFFYLAWPSYLDIRPSTGDMIKPSRVVNVDRSVGPFKIPFIFPPLHYYQYYYDVSFPIIAEIKSTDEFFNETYTMFIAFEANIRDNKNIRDWFEGRGTYGPRTEPMMKVGAADSVQESLDNSDTLTSEEAKKMDQIITNYTKSLFCGEKQRISGNITITIIDGRNNTPLDGVEISYSCGDYSSCRIGQTSDDGEGNINLVTRLPVCYGGGKISAEKQGYLENTLTEITTKPDEKQEAQIYLEPVRTKNVSFKKYDIMRLTYNDSMYEETKLLVWNPVKKNLTSEDMVILSVNKLPDTAQDKPYSKFLLFYGNDSLNKDLFRTIDLVPGKYNLYIQYFYTNKTTIPKQCMHVCKECNSDRCMIECRKDGPAYTNHCLSDPDTLGCVNCKCDVAAFVPEDDILVETSILGGFEANDTEPWVLTKYDLDNGGGTIEFNIARIPPPRCITDFEEMEQVNDFYTTYRTVLLPEIKT